MKPINSLRISEEQALEILRREGYDDPETTLELMAVIAQLVRENYDEEGNPKAMQ